MSLHSTKAKSGIFLPHLLVLVACIRNTCILELFGLLYNTCNGSSVGSCVFRLQFHSSSQQVGSHVCKWALNWTLPFRAQSVARSWSPFWSTVTVSHLVSIFPVMGKMGGATEKTWIEKFCSKDTAGRCFLHGTAFLDKYCSVIQKVPLKINYL